MTGTVSLRAPEVRTVSALGLQLREVEASGRYLEGRAVPYGEWANIGWFMEEMALGVFERSIKEAARGLPLLMWHDNRTWPIGVSEKFTETSRGLDAVWKLDTSAEAERAAELAEKSMLTGLSVGFVPIRSEWAFIDWDDWDPDLGPEHMDKVTRLEGRLLEVSLTPTPAFAGAQVSLVRTREAKKVKEGRQSAELTAWRNYLESVKR
ncbi:MAG: HK97 family phage prohead protease [Thermomicrobiales bacterium]